MSFKEFLNESSLNEAGGVTFGTNARLNGHPILDSLLTGLKEKYLKDDYKVVQVASASTSNAYDPWYFEGIITIAKIENNNLIKHLLSFKYDREGIKGDKGKLQYKMIDTTVFNNKKISEIKKLAPQEADSRYTRRYPEEMNISKKVVEGGEITQTIINKIYKESNAVIKVNFEKIQKV